MPKQQSIALCMLTTSSSTFAPEVIVTPERLRSETMSSIGGMRTKNAENNRDPEGNKSENDIERNSESASESESDDEDVDRTGMLGELSAATLSALMQFMSPGDAPDFDDSPPPPPPPPTCMIASTFARLQATDHKNEVDSESVLEKDFRPFTATPIENAVEMLLANGVVRVDNALSADICDTCRASVLAELQAKLSLGEEECIKNGFGNVMTRENRWDLYLRNEGCHAAALQALFGTPLAPLAQLFSQLFGGKDTDFHEFSALVSDKGACSQPIHPDTWYKNAACPLYTVFVALQDVLEDMGPTVFLPNTNNAADHDRLTGSDKKRFLDTATYQQGLLKKGDLAVMDSRTLHCGSANSSGKRALLYFTLRNPHFDFTQKDTAPASGSKFADLAISLDELLGNHAV